MANIANGSSQTGIKIIIVGAGFAGLSCAIESRRKGHEVILLERFKELKVLGKFLVSSSDATLLRLRPTGDVSE
jgi:monoamine oxidase